MAFSRALLVVLSVVLEGCYLSHGRAPAAGDVGMDGSAPDASLDVGTRRDATLRDIGVSTGVYWTLERRDSRLRIEHALGCRQYEGGRIALTVTAPISTVCEHAGPVDIVGDAGRLATVTAYVWVEHRADPDACLGVMETSQRTFLLPANEGTFTAVSDDGASRVEYRVMAIDDLPCTHAGAHGAACVADCECEDGLACIPDLGDIAECFGGHCGDACNVGADVAGAVYGTHLECDTFEQCRPGSAASECAPIEGVACVDGCPPGSSCDGTDEPSECDWDLRLSGANRHPCGADADCEAGLHCVEHRTGERSCEVPCFTNEMRCPFMHECQRERWVCEWLGE